VKLLLFVLSFYPSDMPVLCALAADRVCNVGVLRPPQPPHPCTLDIFTAHTLPSAAATPACFFFDKGMRVLIISPLLTIFV
jgi:hypothetical protein